jgi:predicted NBD/HSP70 family sugar kinase
VSDVIPATGQALPRMAVLRDITDRAVLAEVFTHGRVTRAEIATRTGISRPTISESVRRLEQSGLLVETGSRTTGRRGRVATFYELTPDTGYVVAIAVDQSGIHTCAADLTGAVFDERRRPPTATGDQDALVGEFRAVLAETVTAGGARSGPLRAVALSVANPVDPGTGDIVALPDSPFPEGLVRPAALLADLVPAPVRVDNDVNWAALAERRLGAARDTDTFAYLYVGAGLGMGLYLADQPVRGVHGLAGEVGYLQEVTAAGTAPVTLAETLARSGFGRADAPSMDVSSVLATLDGPDSTVDGFAAAIARIIANTCAVIDPGLVLLGGPIGGHRTLLDRVRAHTADAPIPVRVEAGAITEAASLRGATVYAVERGREELLTAPPLA